MDTFEVDKSNKPYQINSIDIPSKGMSPQLTANETWALFRFLPVAIEDKVPVDNIYWKLFLQLQA